MSPSQSQDHTPKARVRIICISDTHNQTPSIPSGGDILIHAGDLTNQGSHPELIRQTKWLQSLPGFKAKIVIAGNHDITLDSAFYAEHGESFHNTAKQDVDQCQKVMRNEENGSITYLCHEPIVLNLDLGGDRGRVRINVFGSPYSPASGKWAFGYGSDEEARNLWNHIPDDTDILVTHTPPRGHRDIPGAPNDTRTGCEILRQALWRVRPILHVCGHMHEGRGADRVIWSNEPNQELSTSIWQDPGTSGKKQSLVDLSGKKGQQPLVEGRETCIVNAAIKAWSHGAPGPKTFNKPIVIDVMLPIYTE